MLNYSGWRLRKELSISGGKVLRADGAESTHGVLGAELESVFLCASVGELELGILASGHESVVVNILEGEDLVNNREAGSSILHLWGKATESGVFGSVSFGEIAVGSETIVENVIHELISEPVSTNGDGSKGNETVEGSSHMDVDIVLGTGAIGVIVTIFLISSFTFGIVIIFSEPGDDFVSNITKGESRNDISQGNNHKEGRCLNGFLPGEGVLEADATFSSLSKSSIHGVPYIVSIIETGQGHSEGEEFPKYNNDDFIGKESISKGGTSCENSVVSSSHANTGINGLNDDVGWANECGNQSHQVCSVHPGSCTQLTSEEGSDDSVVNIAPSKGEDLCEVNVLR